MKSLFVLAAVLVVAVIAGTGLALRHRRLAAQRRNLRDRRRREQQELWDRHMAGKSPGPGHHSSVV